MDAREGVAARGERERERERGTLPDIQCYVVALSDKIRTLSSLTYTYLVIVCIRRRVVTKAGIYFQHNNQPVYGKPLPKMRIINFG